MLWVWIFEFNFLALKMELSIYQIDAFTDKVLSGNPAAIVPLPEWLPDVELQAIAAENNLSETAYLVNDGKTRHIRWFTPTHEVDICGHATLATAHYLFEHQGLQDDQITLNSRSGPLIVEKVEKGYRMDFPLDKPRKADPMKTQIRAAIGVEPITCMRGREDYFAVLPTAEQVKQLKPDLSQVAKLDARGLLVTARGEEVDFVSRCFFPAFGIDEDPVTGSAHTLLAPYWSEKLGKTKLVAMQESRRSGKVYCEVLENRVILGGEAVTYLEGKIFLK